MAPAAVAPTPVAYSSPQPPSPPVYSVPASQPQSPTVQGFSMGSLPPSGAPAAYGAPAPPTYGAATQTPSPAVKGTAVSMPPAYGPAPYGELQRNGREPLSSLWAGVGAHPPSANQNRAVPSCQVISGPGASAEAQGHHVCIFVQLRRPLTRLPSPTCRALQQPLQQRRISHTSSSLDATVWSSACWQVALPCQAQHRGELPATWPPLSHVAACAHLFQGYGCARFWHPTL